ncbi:hypothetical protein BDV96DRAFT_650533 [Lophiotrema nucula]|uniref:Uncharacterized protein n=1 Tax=Lophiotrema nucula TaxID=690887 RepID=A0A6A5YWK1_9PLEO|nr:hypothetical protein BDV96DRAFT_650533 [Lophiotrema nucula]
MPPIAFGDKINTASMAGTWLGSLFTGIGLIALISQLQAFLKNIRGRRRYLYERSAGDWAAVIPRYLPETGLVEAILPGFLGWMQQAYVGDWTIQITQNDRLSSGSSGWSKLFAHCGISAQQLLTYGGPGARIVPAVTGRKDPRPAPLADTIVEEGRLLYGFSRYEFTALMIITGNALEVFSLSGSAASGQYLGTILMANTEPVPFAQLARFDSWDGIRGIKIREEQARHVTIVPIKKCINYALGILDTSLLKHRPYVIPSDSTNEYEQGELKHWTKRPRVQQLKWIRYLWEQVVSISGAEIMDYSQQSDTQDRSIEAALESILPTASRPQTQDRLALELGIAMVALDLGAAENIGRLQEMLKSHCSNATPGWSSPDEQANALSRNGDIRTEFFCQSANTCTWYYKAMELVFTARGLQLDQVRIALAAKITEQYMENFKLGVEEHDRLRRFLNGGRSLQSVPEWAVQIYAAYVWAWLSDSIRMPTDDVFARFKRRVFLA